MPHGYDSKAPVRTIPRARKQYGTGTACRQCGAIKPKGQLGLCRNCLELRPPRRRHTADD